MTRYRRELVVNINRLPYDETAYHSPPHLTLAIPPSHPPYPQNLTAATDLDLVTYVLSMSANPIPHPRAINAAVPMATTVHVTTGCTAFDTFRGKRVPAEKPNSVAIMSDNWRATGTNLQENKTDAAPVSAAPIPKFRMSGAPKIGGGFGVTAPTLASAAGARGERAPTTAAVDARLANQPPHTMMRRRKAFAAEGAGDSGNTTRVGTKNTGSHLRYCGGRE